MSHCSDTSPVQTAVMRRSIPSQLVAIINGNDIHGNNDVMGIKWWDLLWACCKLCSCQVCLQAELMPTHWG